MRRANVERQATTQVVRVLWPERFVVQRLGFAARRSMASRLLKVKLPVYPETTHEPRDLSTCGRDVMPTAVILTDTCRSSRPYGIILTISQKKRIPQAPFTNEGFTVGELSWTVAIAQIGMGNVRASFETERAIANFSPDVALFVGIAGGLKDVQLGGVVAATKVYEYESGKAAVEFYARPELHFSSYRMEQRARAVARNQNWQKRILPTAPELLPDAIVKPVAAGAKLSRRRGPRSTSSSERITVTPLL